MELYDTSLDPSGNIIIKYKRTVKDIDGTDFEIEAVPPVTKSRSDIETEMEQVRQRVDGFKGKLAELQNELDELTRLGG